ncbi:MAG: hypothetical protein AABW63_00375 [Nanoarchaeota archaeon]
MEKIEQKLDEMKDVLESLEETINNKFDELIQVLKERKIND